MEELKVINQNLASEMEVYKKKEVETTHLKDEVTKERSLLVERNVRILSRLFTFALLLLSGFFNFRDPHTFLRHSITGHNRES